MPKLFEAILVNVSSFLMVVGWEENTALTEARNGYILYRISQDMLDSYIGLHSHLMTVGGDQNWFGTSGDRSPC
jgi:hypothetical protein